MDLSVVLRELIAMGFRGPVSGLTEFLHTNDVDRNEFDKHFFDDNSFVTEELRYFLFHISYFDVAEKTGFTEVYSSEILESLEEEEASDEEEIIDHSVSYARDIFLNWQSGSDLCLDFSLASPVYFNNLLNRLKIPGDPLYWEYGEFFKPVTHASLYELAMKSMLAFFSYGSTYSISSFFSDKNRSKGNSYVDFQNIIPREWRVALGYFAEYSGIDHSDFPKMSTSTIHRFNNINMDGRIGYSGITPMDTFELIKSLISNPFIRGYIKSFEYFDREVTKKVGSNYLFQGPVFADKADTFIKESNKEGITSAEDWKDVEQFFL